VPQNLPPGHGDERRITQVLLNLVGNAIKFTDQGEVAIKAWATNGSFKVAVCDTGPGIGIADQAKIFEEFKQADSSITHKKGGLDWDCRFPSVLSKCTAGDYGSSLISVVGRPFPS
jgi:signal transduction histidine kinase